MPLRPQYAQGKEFAAGGAGRVGGNGFATSVAREREAAAQAGDMRVPDPAPLHEQEAVRHARNTPHRS